MRNTEASYRAYWATLTDRSEREVYVPQALRTTVHLLAKQPARLAVGDKIRILLDGLDCATVERGDVLTVAEVRSTEFDTNAPRLINTHGTWSFGLADEGTGWERVSSFEEGFLAVQESMDRRG